MLNIRLRTEYSFRKAYGSVNEVVKVSGDCIGICDTGTWGHVAFNNACSKIGKKPLFGVEIAVVNDPTDRSKQPVNMMSFISKNNSGLKEMYSLVTKSTSKEHF